MRKILLIEDDEATAQAYAESFSEEYSVEVATSAQQGLTQAIHSKPDLILLDIMLPGGKNGFDFLQDLKNNSQISQIPVVILTNLDDQRQAALDYGAQECFVKANTSIPEIEVAIEKLLKK
ncbi:MAG: response regulator [Patescibacteria group bacterium]